MAAPAIVQVENSPEGRPQSGLASADIVYEYVAEGGIGRFSLIFFATPPARQRIGPVRSVRTVTLRITKQYQGYLVYSGASSYITGLLNSEQFPSFDENSANGNLFRDNARSAPHNLYTDGNGIAKLSSMSKQPPVSYQLWSRSSVPPAGGKAVASFSVPVSDFEQPTFTWHAELGGYTRAEQTGQVNDPDSGKPLVIPTVIVQQVTVTSDPKVVDVNGVNGVDHQITGAGKAQVFAFGREYDATWSQPDTGPPTLTLAGGSPAPVAAGEVWIDLVPAGKLAS